jgi:DNA polymerase-3 subunit alpha
MGNIKSVKYIGDLQTYDLEVDHLDHQFYLSNGVLTSNSHATLYSMVGYQTAYLKAHYPIEFLLANLMFEVNSNAQDAKSNIEKIKKEIRDHNVKIVAPNINTSQLTYTIGDDNKLITGLDALKFVGEDAIKEIIAKRPFKNFFDFMVRVDSKKVRANNIQALAASGCLDEFKIPRKLIYLYCSDYRKKLQVWCKKHDPTKEEFIYPWPNDAEWGVSELYALEQFYLGESFVCKPYQAHGKFFDKEHTAIKEIRKYKNKTSIQSMIAIVKDFFEFKVKKETSKYYGQSMIKAVIEDMHGDQCSCTIFPDRWQMVQERLKQIHSRAVFDVGLALHFSGSTNDYDDNVGVILDNLFNISMIPSLPADLKAKKVNLKESKAKTENVDRSPDKIDNLMEILEDHLYDQGLIDLDEDPEN